MVFAPMVWPVSWPLPAISSTSPRSSSATARRIASLRSGTSPAPRAAVMTAARIAAGIVVRESDGVGFLGGDGAHQRPLAGVAVAAGAEHHDQPVADIGAQRF